MIDIHNYDDGLPISVIVPHGKSKTRDGFFDNMVYPMIEANEAIEIIINDNIGSAPKKRNDGFDKSTQPYVFFCDNDIILPKNYLHNLYDALIKNPDKGYAYSGYYGIVMTSSHPVGKNYKIDTIPFNGENLKRGNYISTMSLFRREIFPKFDESLKRFQDWSVFLTLLEKNIEGIAVQNNEFYAYYLDEGITSNSNSEREAYMKILEKHKLL